MHYRKKTQPVPLSLFTLRFCGSWPMTKFSPYHNTLPQVLFVKCLGKTNDRLLHTITWNCLDIPMNSKLVQKFLPVMLLQIFAVKHFEKSNKESRLILFSMFRITSWIIRQESEDEEILLLLRFLHSEFIFHQSRACVPNYQRAFGIISTAVRICMCHIMPTWFMDILFLWCLYSWLFPLSIDFKAVFGVVHWNEIGMEWSFPWHTHSNLWCAKKWQHLRDKWDYYQWTM